MHITYDDAFDSGAWPGPGAGAAVAGELWVGLAGLLGALEGLTGTARPWPSRAARVAALVPRLATTPGFWQASAATDALSTAERLLDLRDTLVLHGWHGAVESPRLKELEALALYATGSPGDRLATLAAALADFPRVVDDVTLLVTRASLPRRVRDCLSALEANGTRVEERAPAPAKAPPGSNLAGAKARAGFTPTRDGSLQLIRPFAPMTGADAVAAALAADAGVPTVIVGADAVLDHALARYGLPTVGGAGDASDNAVLQLLPLVIAMGAKPQDPARVVELLTLPVGPVPPSIARRLVRALQEWPAVGSPAWTEALTEGLARIEDQDDRAKLHARLMALFDGTVASSRWPVAELFARTHALRMWLIGREQHEEDEDAKVRYGAALIQCAELEELLRAAGVTEVSTAQLKLFVERASSSVDGGARYRARAGLRGVGQPGGVAGPIERVVWWDFTLTSAPTPKGSIWSRDELAALAAAGVHVPSAGEQARALAQRFRRPLEQATGELWLVCPEVAVDGGEAAPHPLWDEVQGALADTRRARALIFEAPAVTSPLPSKKRAALALPQPRAAWTTKHPIEKRDKESASSIDGLLGCPLQWTLNYVGHLEAGQTATLPGDQLLLGKLAHEVVGQTLNEHPSSPAKAATDVEQRFQALGPTLAAPLFLPGRDAERAEALQAARAAAKALAALLEEGWQVSGVEEQHRGKALGTALEGRLDLVLKKGKARAIIDLKWSGERYRRESLEAGTALQLATYAELLRQDGADDVAVGYFIIVSQAILSADARLTKSGAALPVSHDIATTWRDLERSWVAAWKQVSTGALTAPGALRGAAESTTRDADGELRFSAPCRFCDYAGLCGRLYGTVEEDEDGED